MNSLKELIKQHSDGKDPKTMEEITDIIGSFLKNNVSEESYYSLYKDIYSKIVGGHYNKEFADKQIARMYHTNSAGEKRYAPYWTENETREIYEKVKAKIPAEYNFYDFEVTLNMVKSDYCTLLEKWYKEAHPQSTPPPSPIAAAQTGGESEACEKWCCEKMVDLAVNWLDDPDNPFGKEKVWGYFNS